MTAGRSRRLSVVLVVLGFGVAAVTAGGTALAASQTDAEPQATAEGELAVLEGRVIDLSSDWEGAEACVVYPDDTMSECFASEAELEKRVADLADAATASTTARAAGPPIVAASSSCGSYLKLYDGTYYGSPSLWLSTRLQWLNLANYGFNQKTSSFKVGACSSYFADGAWGGTPWYPTYLTQAYDVGPTMLSGWNNDVSSVYIL